MNTPQDIIDKSNKISDELAGVRMSRGHARLYSHQTRLRSGQAGLSSWGDNETEDRLSEAELLIEVGFIKRENEEPSWRKDFRRAGELFEWLSALPSKNEEIPLMLLSAAAYQLAGYPARALGVLNSNATEIKYSKIIESFLRADFKNTITEISAYWSGDPLLYDEVKTIGENPLSREIIRSTVGVLGIFASWIRWGEDDRLDKSLGKLEAIAQIMSQSGNAYSWLLACLVSEIIKEYKITALRSNVKQISERKNTEGRTAFESYTRLAFSYKSALTWPSQRAGITHILADRSFALCTPTGSGKTRIAELAILDSLFASKDTTTDNESPPIALYLVPKRALASEIESKISRVLRYVGDGKITITSLYGGSDWGPSDAFLSLEQRAVVISTHEKAEALVRFLGKEFVNRIRLIVIDEAHNIEYEGKSDDLKKMNSRALRLEVLVSRLLSYQKEQGCRAIALSAVAAGIEENLAKWVSKDQATDAVVTQYRSTRQLIGKLVCLPNDAARIDYDLLDGQPLHVEIHGVDESPYIPNPYPPHPAALKFKSSGPEKKLRPYVFWAALNFAGRDRMGQYHSVMISVSQLPGGYADDLLDLLDDSWGGETVPDYFNRPTEGTMFEKYNRCLKSCEDYFGQDSREYRLLTCGVVLHHGKMPGLMSRLLIDLVQDRIINVVIATSTLTEGVNLPFEVIIIPTLRRSNSFITDREFANLVGRAGRPGASTEGRTLVAIDQTFKDYSTDYSAKRNRKEYDDLINKLSATLTTSVSVKRDDVGPLANLVTFIYTKWSEIAKTDSEKEFISWLETTKCDDIDDEVKDAIESLDTLDGILLGAIAEIETHLADDQAEVNYEDILQRLWENTFSYYSSTIRDTIEQRILIRGKAIFNKIYPDKKVRKSIYKTNLTPREGKVLIDSISKIKELFLKGISYYSWDGESRVKYIIELIDFMQAIQSFKLDKTTKKENWEEILHWWLDPASSSNKPTPEQVSKWYNYGAQNFAYKFNWGLGCAVGLILQNSSPDKSTLDQWAESGLPWSVFWLKDMITWGLHDPAAVYLMMQGTADTRQEAIEQAAQYYKQFQEVNNDSLFDPRQIAKWAPVSIEMHQLTQLDGDKLGDFPCDVELTETFGEQEARHFRVFPILQDQGINWVDPSGFILAKGKLPTKWNNTYLHSYDFMLDPKGKAVSATLYL